MGIFDSIIHMNGAGTTYHQALRMEAKHWSSASSCIMQLRQEVS